MKLLTIDWETTGLPLHPDAKDSVQPRGIEFAAVLSDETGEVLDSDTILINPHQKLDPKITKITGITDDDLKDAPSFPDVAETINDYFERADALVAHNLPFDYTITRLEAWRAGLLETWSWPAINICTVQEFAEDWGKRPRLVDLYAHFMGKPLQQTHRALDDVEALVSVCVTTGVFHDAAAAMQD